jgi:hypothetical protein
MCRSFRHDAAQFQERAQLRRHTLTMKIADG